MGLRVGNFFLVLVSMEITQKNCIECGDKLRGRIDKKFCSDACRTSYHNKRGGEVRGSIRQIDSKLKQNWRILKSCYESQNASNLQIELRKMIQHGFLTDFHTHREVMPNGQEFQFCYDFGYAKKDDYTIYVIKQAYS